MEYNQSYVKVSIEIEENEWELGESDLFEVVIRKNKKRSFLFASKVLGKYIAVHPYTPQLIGRILAEAFIAQVEEGGQAPSQIEKRARMKALCAGLKVPPDLDFFEAMKHERHQLSKRTLFIGFAETATALGHSVFSAFDENGAYLHTTRIPISSEEPMLYFKEEHSHAVDHTCYVRTFTNFEAFERIVLVDDEITTGKTALNLVRAIAKVAPIKEFVVMSLLDWRSLEDTLKYEQLEEELGIRIQSISLLRGRLSVEQLKDMAAIALNNEKIDWIQTPTRKVQVEGKNDRQKGCKMQEVSEEARVESKLWHEIVIPLDERMSLETKAKDGISRTFEFMKQATGRFGLMTEENKQFEKKAAKIGNALRQYRKYKNCLCLGTEEFIYWPCVVAGYMGDGVKFACSARSPIITLNKADYAIKDAICFENPEDTALLSYIYNLEGQGYEEVFWFLERNVCEAFKTKVCQALRDRGILAIHFVIL